MRPEDVPDGPILVDTDVATWVMRNDEQALPWRPLLRGHLLVLSFVNVGELLAVPVLKGWQAKRAAAWADEIRRHFVTLPFAFAVTEMWAPLHVKYRGHLQKGGANDLWIAASALSADPALPLATNNLSDFGKVAANFPLRLVHPDLPT
ncbi:PIN domain-containing protein [Geodermatophilus sp. TF02-6]|uniref:PIN domain-containing protein n=1 Tax=Geodermatophilus sp. TF02-6 TaxID=2250575 RepID=UPI001314C83B|nr:PIN domain-containing protein [Geodermatophilus sp. TF02-6]